MIKSTDRETRVFVKRLNLLNKVLNFSAELYLKSAGDLFVYHGDYEAALRMADKTLELQPDDVRAMVLRGDILYCMNRDLESLQMFNEVLKHYPDCLEAHISKAGVLDVLGETKEALTYCNRAFELMAPKHRFLLPSLYDQKIQLLMRLKHYRQAQLLLKQAEEQLTEEESTYLKQCYQSDLRQLCRHRSRILQKANDLNLTVINGKHVIG